MVGKKQKIRSMVMTDEEQAEIMLKEDDQKRKGSMDWKRIAHFFRIHVYSKRVKSGNYRDVYKCKYCGLLHIVRSLSMNRMFLYIFHSCFTGFLLVDTVIQYCSGEPLIPWMLLKIIIGIPSLFIWFKRTLEKLWMGSE